MTIAAQNTKFDSEVYERIGYDELTNYAIYSIANKGAEATFENLVAEAFTLFPKRFSLRGYPQWPDSAVINKSWLRCRTDKHYIEGSVKEGFKLTPKGLRVAEEVERRFLGQTSPSNAHKEIQAEIRTKAGRLLRAVEKSKAFAHFKETGNIGDLKDHELTDMLLCMPDSDIKVIKHNLEQFMQAAGLYNRDDILKILKLVKARLLAARGLSRV
ncbi:MAG: hypothetical protein HYU29_03570 [Chloroflexi bacterium]|nr:hypothetical protein [Chloroflexota bacterium]